MKDLINITKINIGDIEVNSVNAKELHAFLESDQHFSDWIKKRISKFNFIENKDYIVHKIMNSIGQVIESSYIITFDMAKHLGLVENNDKGREIRDYFIMIENKYREEKELLNQPLNQLLPKEIEQRNIKAILNTAKDQADFFKLEDTGRMLWGQNLLLKNNLPCPNNIPLLTNVNINLYGLSEIYDKFNIRGKGARVKQQSIKSILSEFQTDSEYAVKCMFENNGHTDMMYKYTDKSIDLIKSKIEAINNI